MVAEWVDEEMQASPKERKRKNKKWRRVRREEKPDKELDRQEEEYTKPIKRNIKTNREKERTVGEGEDRKSKEKQQSHLDYCEGANWNNKE